MSDSWLTSAHFGTAETPLPAVTEDDAPDADGNDEELAETPPDVVEMLGFDPRELFEDARNDSASIERLDKIAREAARFRDRLTPKARQDAANAPGNGDLPYGKMSDAGYADPGYRDGEKRYPLKKGGEWDAERIRAAWNYIHKRRDADKYSASQLKRIKEKIVAAWKKAIDVKGPPEARE